MRSSTRQLILTIGWSAFAVPDMLLWRNAVALVSFMSVYAIIISHYTTYAAFKAKEEIQEIEN